MKAVPDSGLVGGVDEAGRGPLAGPVLAAAVILDPVRPICGLADSKALCERRREELCAEIEHSAISWAIGRAEVVEIDRLNILHATLLAMRRAVMALTTPPTEVLVDGLHCPEIPFPARGIVRGDALIPQISAASILAKVARDREMAELDRSYPGYGFARHKGYPTREHLQALAELGVSSVHRRSFRPVRECLQSVFRNGGEGDRE